jgi:hypothetical protein
MKQRKDIKRDSGSSRSCHNQNTINIDLEDCSVDYSVVVVALD